jgi:hypothetical protein
MGPAGYNRTGDCIHEKSMKTLPSDSDSNFESGTHPAHASSTTPKERQDVERRETNASGDRADGARCHAPDAGDPSADSRADAKDAPEEEIEVTDAMIDAGLAEFFLYSPRSDSAADSVENIYLAMARASARARGHS